MGTSMASSDRTAQSPRRCPSSEDEPRASLWNQNDNAGSPPYQILLDGKTLIRRHENVVSFSFHHIEQLAVALLGRIHGKRTRNGAGVP